jgi:arabinose-5-phosphate isomerase
MNLDFSRKVLLEEAEAIRVLAASLDERFEKAVAWLASCTGRVIACGLGKSGHIARKAAGTLSSTGTPSLFLHAAEAVHGDLGIITPQDVLLMYSHSGETDELVRLFPSVTAIGAKTILITSRPESSAGRLADLVLPTYVTHEACPNNLAPTTSTTAMLALSDALALAAMEQRRFTREDYARLHPGGTLGKRLLLRVRDVMRKGSDTAMVKQETSVLEVMRTITKAGAGAACVVNEDLSLVGFISDGDLRRHFMNSPDPSKSNAAEIMSRSPAWTIEPDLLAAEALEYFQNLPRKVGEMPVVEEGKVVGLLMLKDLLRTGIV